jgi:hypothetical protein
LLIGWSNGLIEASLKPRKLGRVEAVAPRRYRRFDTSSAERFKYWL